MGCFQIEPSWLSLELVEDLSRLVFLPEVAFDGLLTWSRRSKYLLPYWFIFSERVI